MMKRKQILRISFFISLIAILTGSFLKIMHAPSADLLLQLSVAFYFLFAGIVIYEVYQSNKIEKTEKIMWTIGILFIGSIVGILYLIFGRNRIVNNVLTSNSSSSLYEN